jgi:sortase A
VTSVVRLVVRTSAELLVTLGLVVVAFAVYVVFWSDVQNAAAQSKLRDTFQAQVEQAARTQVVSGRGGKAKPAPIASDLPSGSTLGVIRIPRLGDDWSWVMVEGVTDDDIAKGPGHFPGTAMPGQIGNFAVAGHRATHGEPFAHLDEVRKGDEVSIETVNGTYTYVVDGSKIVDPTAVGVIDPVPGKPGAKPKKALITLVTCNPRWGSTERMIISGHLTSTQIAGA